MKEKCEHCAETVLFSWGRFSINKCDWACGTIRLLWVGKNGVTRSIFDRETEVATKKYDYTTTTDGITYAFEIKPEVPEWTSRQFTLNHRYLTLAYVIVSFLGAITGITIAVLLQGE